MKSYTEKYSEVCRKRNLDSKRQDWWRESYNQIFREKQKMLIRIEDYQFLLIVSIAANVFAVIVLCVALFF